MAVSHHTMTRALRFGWYKRLSTFTTYMITLAT